MRTSRRLALLGATTALLLGGAGIANADDVYNDLDATIDSSAEVMPLNAGGATGSTTLAVHPTGSDGKAGCNLQGNIGDLVVNVNSSAAAVATVSPSQVTFGSCEETHKLTVTPLASGSTTISLAEVSNASAGSFDLRPAEFTVNVTGSANTAPSIDVRGVTEGARYDKGSVPTASCSVTDAEDGPSSFDATLSPVTGTYAVDGIGSQTATCRYIDEGGLEASSHITYTIADPTPPSIGYTLNPTDPDGTNGWYKGDVTLTWNVTENESPHSLSPSGCDTVTVSTDQVPTDYTCSAISAGGTATPVTAIIKRDGTAPSVTAGAVDGTLGNNGWYTSDVTAHFTATDATSGPSNQSADTKSNGAEGAAVVLNSPAFTDNAGNKSAVGAATTTVKIDHSAPYGVTFSGGPNDGTSYYYGQVPQKPTCDATDDVSGLMSCTVTGTDDTANAVGEHSWTATATDNAGNTTSKTISYTVLAWTDTGFYAPVNMAGALNTVKAGSTVPMKFNVYAGSELTDTSVVKSFSAKQVNCGELGAALSDPIEVTTTGGTALRYDTTGLQFVQNWKTPTSPGNCYTVTMTTQDGSSLSANFKLK